MAAGGIKRANTPVFTTMEGNAFMDFINDVLPNFDAFRNGVMKQTTNVHGQNLQANMAGFLSA